jgi:hypothetical protein
MLCTEQCYFGYSIRCEAHKSALIRVVKQVYTWLHAVKDAA